MNIDETIRSIDEMVERALQELSDAQDESEVEAVRVALLGRKGTLTAVLRGIGDLPDDAKPAIGSAGGRAKKTVTEGIDEAMRRVTAPATGGDPTFDPTLPGRTPSLGRSHPVAVVMDEIVNILMQLGFTVAEGPEIETDFYNFEALNFPPDHPARDMQDSYYVTDDLVLRTHTSPVQIRLMEVAQPPIRSIMPGRVYRNEVVSAKSLNFFNQVEGLYVDKGVSLADLKGELEEFCHRFFGSDVSIRLRPSFFPFTEPSCEMDVSCVICGGGGCRVCKSTGWLEIGGAGMVDPNVFEAVGYDPEIYAGYAFGLGVERPAMIKYGVDDIRLFYENDVRFLAQF